MIRSTKVSLKFSNTNKKHEVSWLIDEYRNLVQEYIEKLWDGKAAKFIPKDILDSVETKLSARMKQCASKQASGIVRGTKRKFSKREFIIKKLTESGEHSKAQELQQIQDSTVMSKPSVADLELELDSRFVKVDLDNTTKFDGWLTLSSIGEKKKIILPFKRTKHFNRLSSKGKMLSGVRLSKNSLTFMFEIEPEVPIYRGVLGIDVGQKDALSCSNGQQISVCPHGHTYHSICVKIAQKKKGSRGFERAQRHRTNYLNWVVNQINFTNFNVLQRENIKNLRRGKRQRRAMQSWNYRELFSIIDRKCEELGVQVRKVSPTFTSKRCSRCGYTKDSNRKLKIFRCGNCGYTADADMNAALNLSLPLVEIPYKNRHKFDSRTGFYWTCGQESIVPDVKETKIFHNFQ